MFGALAISSAVPIAWLSWNVPLWDIFSTTQICGIGEQETVILDNAHAAHIRWKTFTQVILAVQRESIKRLFSRVNV